MLRSPRALGASRGLLPAGEFPRLCEVGFAALPVLPAPAAELRMAAGRLDLTAAAGAGRARCVARLTGTERTKVARRVAATNAADATVRRLQLQLWLRWWCGPCRQWRGQLRILGP